MFIVWDASVLPAMHDQANVDAGLGRIEMHQVGGEISNVKRHPGAAHLPQSSTDTAILLNLFALAWRIFSWPGFFPRGPVGQTWQGHPVNRWQSAWAVEIGYPTLVMMLTL